MVADLVLNDAQQMQRIRMIGLDRENISVNRLGGLKTTGLVMGHGSRQGFGNRTCTVIKTRDHSWKSLYVDPNDGNNPYWALNKNINRY